MTTRQSRLPYSISLILRVYSFFEKQPNQEFKKTDFIKLTNLKIQHINTILIFLIKLNLIETYKLESQANSIYLYKLKDRCKV